MKIKEIKRQKAKVKYQEIGCCSNGIHGAFFAPEALRTLAGGETTGKNTTSSSSPVRAAECLVPAPFQGAKVFWQKARWFHHREIPRRPSGARIGACLFFSLFLPFAFCLLPFDSTAARQPLFIEVAAETGLNFHHFTGATGEFFMPEIMGAGGALFDYDNDGDLDVYLLQGLVLDEKKKPGEAKFPPPRDWRPGNRLFRNELVPSGKLKFTDVTQTAGVGLVAYGMGAATGDYDNDGDVDLYVTNFGSNVLYQNNGNGTFTDVTARAGVDDQRWSSSAAFVDYDHDGRLDLFVCNYVDFLVKGNKPCFSSAGEMDYCSPSAYRPVPARLFHNEGGGKFTDATQSTGIGLSFGPGLGVTCGDFNGDGLTDIYVANDGAANLLWLGIKDPGGNVKFEEGGLMAGASYAADGAPRAGMGVTAGDIDNDGDDDLLVTNLTKQGSTLYRNSGKGLFDDATVDFNLAQPSFLSTGFGASWFDYDNDGWLDLFAANGAVTILPSLRGQPYPFHQRNQLFHNEAADRVNTAAGRNPAGRRVFREVTDEAGAALKLSEVSRGAAFGDVDNDGDVDVLVTNNNGPARLLINQTGRAGQSGQNATKNHWIQVKLIGVKDNRDGIGARIAVRRKSGNQLWGRVHTDGSYLSANDPRAHFGLGKDADVEAIGVIWPSGSRELWTSVKVDSLNQLKQGTGKVWEAGKK